MGAQACGPPSLDCRAEIRRPKSWRELSFAAPTTTRYSLHVTGFFKPNITRAGRIARALWGAGVAGLGVLALSWKPWVAGVLFAASAFALFEALRGWCLLRACGLRTKW